MSEKESIRALDGGPKSSTSNERTSKYYVLPACPIAASASIPSAATTTKRSLPYVHNTADRSTHKCIVS